MLFGEAAQRLCNPVSLLLGWRPREFWESTPAELALALQPPVGLASSPDRGTIAKLLQRFPDQEVTNHG